MAIKFGAKSAKIVRLGVGALAGSGLNFLVKAVNIPGASNPVIPITTAVSLNVGDVVELGLSGAALAYAYKKKKSTMKLVAGGMIAGILANKILETYGANITPITATAGLRYTGMRYGQQGAFPMNMGMSRNYGNTYGVHMQTNKGRYTIG